MPRRPRPRNSGPNGSEQFADREEDTRYRQELERVVNEPVVERQDLRRAVRLCPPQLRGSLQAACHAVGAG